MNTPIRKKKWASLRGRLVLLGLGTTAGFLALCVGFLLLLIFTVSKPYIENELDFAMRETGSNLSVKTDLLADTLLKLRRDEVLMAALAGTGLEQGSGSDESPTERALSDTVDIYSNKNSETLDPPFLNAVYLYDRAGTFNRVAYPDWVYSVQQAVDGQFHSLYERFLIRGKDTYLTAEGNYLYIAYTLYDRTIQPCGTVIFAVNQSAVRQMMSKTGQYQDAFWFLFDEDGRVLMENEGKGLDGKNQAALLNSRQEKPFVYPSSGTNYRVWVQSMSMGLGGAQGISSNQLSLLLFESVKYYVLALVLALVALGGVLFFVVVRLTRPLSEIAGKLQLVAEQRFDTKLPEYRVQEFSAIADTFNSMTDTIDHLIHDVYEKKLIVMDTEMKFLQSQVNPHFLYNVLNTIALKAKMDGNSEVAAMATNFAGLTQARLNHNGDEKVTLEQELQYVRFYLELQKSRFEEKLRYHISVGSNDLLSCNVPKLTIELIVENAVLHGLEGKTGPGVVYVEVYRTQTGIEILVEDDGVGFERQDGEILLPLPDKNPGGEHNHIALNNAWKLIRHYYGAAYGITIHSRNQVGTRVTVSLPYDKEGDDVPHHHS